jgi:hypothetical protein
LFHIAKKWKNKNKNVKQRRNVTGPLWPKKPIHFGPFIDGWMAEIVFLTQMAQLISVIPERSNV